MVIVSPLRRSVLVMFQSGFAFTVNWLMRKTEQLEQMSQGQVMH